MGWSEPCWFWGKNGILALCGGRQAVYGKHSPLHWALTLRKVPVNVLVYQLSQGELREGIWVLFDLEPQK